MGLGGITNDNESSFDIKIYDNTLKSVNFLKEHYPELKNRNVLKSIIHYHKNTETNPQELEDGNKAKEIVIFTSCDTWGEQAEYIRTGLEFNRFWDNVNKILTACPRIIITFMSTYNALSVFNYEKLIHNIYELKNTYASTDRYWNSAVFLDSSYLRYPTHQTVQILPFDFANNILDQAKLITYYAAPSFDPKHIGYSDVEVQKVK